MSKKVLIDCDPGIDDAVALTMALFDPRLDVVAVTACEGNVSAEKSATNLQALIEHLDPPRWPRIGLGSPPDQGPVIDARHIHGDDGLGNAALKSAPLVRVHPAEKMICDEVRAAPNQLTLLCLGPLTNVARALKRDPEIVDLVHRIFIMGGSVNGIGNVTASAEFNIYADPESARFVFRSNLPKTIVPLDITSRVIFDFDLMRKLPPESSRAGSLLGKSLPFLFRAYRQHLGLESVHIHDAIALAALCHSELFEWAEMHGDVETTGHITNGATIFDRRPSFRGKKNCEVAVEIDAVAVNDYLLRALADAGRATE